MSCFEATYYSHKRRVQIKNKHNDISVCTSPLVPLQCGCNKTCDMTSQCESCEPGCYCAEGMVMVGGKCVEETECPCVHDGVRFEY